MIAVLAVTIGALFGIGLFHILQKDAVKLVLGFSLLTGAVNLFVLTCRTFGGTAPPFVGLRENAVDPTPQALVLTAIVIGFGMMAFLLAVVLSLSRSRRSLNVDRWNELGG